MKGINALRYKKLESGGLIEADDLKPFSKINLKKKRNLKKFLKDPYKYVSDKVYKFSVCYNLTQPLTKSFKDTLDFEITPMSADPSIPQGKIYYVDFKYGK